jgi:hypothetical protein
MPLLVPSLVWERLRERGKRAHFPFVWSSINEQVQVNLGESRCFHCTRNPSSLLPTLAAVITSKMVDLLP